MEEKFVTKAALAQAFSLIESNYVAKEEGKVLSENNYSAADKAIVESIDSKIAEAVEGCAVTKEGIEAALGFAPMTSEEVASAISEQVAQMNVVKRAIFIAAGFGSRMVPVTLNTPKLPLKI